MDWFLLLSTPLLVNKVRSFSPRNLFPPPYYGGFYGGGPRLRTPYGETKRRKGTVNLYGMIVASLPIEEEEDKPIDAKLWSIYID